MSLPFLINTELELDEALTTPGAELIEFAPKLQSPLVVLGAGGKMGPTLAVMAKRARLDLEVVAVSRFSNPQARTWLEEHGVKTISCDLLDEGAVKSLPDSANVIHMVGQKFGTSSNPAPTWAMNTIVPARVAERYRAARIVALSTGNVYPNSEVSRGGSRETDPLTPIGEYPNSAVGRERVFQFFSERNGTPVVLLRLLYAIDLRYGVVVDIAQHIWRDEPISLGNGSFNCIWQADANEFVLRSLALAQSPAAVFNLCRPEIFSVREVAMRLGELLGREPRFTGHELPTALVANAQKLTAELEAPRTSIETILRWVAHWTKIGGRNIGKPTHFEVTDGKY
jgi:nucleoside-diphosphate-sugar epimerase